VVVVVTVQLAACTQDDPTRGPNPSSTSPTAPSSATTSATSNSTSTTTSAGAALVIPEPARANTADGAVAFVNYFTKQANEAYTKLEPQPIVELSEPSCKTCKGMVDAINAWKAKNQNYEGQFVNPINSTIGAFPNDGTAKVVVTTKTDGGRIVDENGSTVSTFPGESGNLSIGVIRVGDRWSVSSIQAAA
jgi:hypothetical protein